MELTFFCGAPVTLLEPSKHQIREQGEKVTSVSENLAGSLVQWSQRQVWEEQVCGKRNKIYELSKTVKEKYSFLAQTRIPVTPCR